MINNSFFKAINDPNNFNHLDKKFIIKIPNHSSKFISMSNTKRHQTHSNTLLLNSTRKFHHSQSKQNHNLTINHSTSRNLQQQTTFSLSKKFLSPRNYSVSKLKKYRFRKQTLSDQNPSHLQTTNYKPSDYCKIKIILANSQDIKEIIELKVKISTTTNLIQLLLNKLKNKSFVAFKVQPQNLLLDLYLTFDYCDISYLNGTSLTLSPILKEHCPKVNINSFEIFNCIGSGGFSKVFLCRFKEDGKFYAMKLIDKKFIIKHKKHKIVMNQRNIMHSINHPFVVKMKFAFQTSNNLAFILEYCPGSQMFSLIKKYKRFNQEMARFYMIQILLGLQYLHSQGIIYRDFKPQNILVDINGHIKIADFGLAKPKYFSANDRSYSFCGSSEYMPPQMILRQGHSLAVDFYCLGAVLYQFVTGLPPFYSKDTNQIYDSTLNQSISFPSKLKLSPQLKNLLKGLLCKDQSYRLGTLYGVKQILAHPWFGKFERQQYLQKQVKPPTNFKSINSINIQPEQLKHKNEIYVIEAKKQQQSDKQDFQTLLDQFYYDYRFSTYQHRNRTDNKWVKRKSSQKKLSNIEISRNSLNLLKRIKTNKMNFRRLTTNQIDQKANLNEQSELYS